MGKITFLNPNDPEQPAAGVYGWFVGPKERAVYVGRSGGRINPLAAPSTLHRGIQEARRSTLSSDTSRRLLDTDFIVGSALLYFKHKGYDCSWKHLSGDPLTESDLRREHNPLLQRSSTRISRVFRLAKPDDGRWERGDASLAEQLLMVVFENELGNAIQPINPPDAAR